MHPRASQMPDRLCTSDLSLALGSHLPETARGMHPPSALPDSSFSLALRCPRGSKYSTCVRLCQYTCQERFGWMPCPPTQPCSEGCQCEEGHFLNGVSCIHHHNCGCILGLNNYHSVRCGRGAQDGVRQLRKGVSSADAPARRPGTTGIQTRPAPASAPAPVSTRVPAIQPPAGPISGAGPCTGSLAAGTHVGVPPSLALPEMLLSTGSREGQPSELL